MPVILPPSLSSSKPPSLWLLHGQHGVNNIRGADTQLTHSVGWGSFALSIQGQRGIFFLPAKGKQRHGGKASPDFEAAVR